MPNKHEPLLLVELKPSQQLKRFLVVMHVLAFGSSIANALPIIVKLALLIGICMHLLFMNKCLKNERYQIKHTDAASWEISSGDDFKPIQILSSTVITTFAVFLHFTDNAHKQSALIVNDALSEDDYRRFIVRLKTAGKK
ncbi:MAG: protein YgfX [Methylobacter sp.]